MVDNIVNLDLEFLSVSKVVSDAIESLRSSDERLRTKKISGETNLPHF
jgi:hypothetical protein